MTTSNVVTLANKAPREREVPPFKPKLGIQDADERAGFYALSNASECGRLAMTIAKAEGLKAALDMLDNIKVAIAAEFKSK